EHKTRKDCKCNDCHDDQLHKGCENLNKCAQMAKHLLNGLAEKWDSQRPDQNDQLSLTPEEK
ncbi:uncharacterized protein EV420DRAFT_1245347, partial [Desarmillaria tabescens]